MLLSRNSLWIAQASCSNSNNQSTIQNIHGTWLHFIHIIHFMKIKQIVTFGANASVSLTLETSFNIDASISNSHSCKCEVSISLILSIWFWYSLCLASHAYWFAYRPRACILLRHFSIYIYDIDVTRYYLNSYLSCSFFR